jgi:hypothetical protein
MEEDVYFITGLSRRGEVWPQFPDLPPGVAGETQLAYVQRYVSPNILSTLGFQVPGGQMQMSSFHREEVRCMCLIIMTLSHFTSDGKHISFPLMYYVDSLVQRPRLIRWMKIFLRLFCFALDCCSCHFRWEEILPIHVQSYLHYFLRGFMPLDQEYPLSS